MVLADEVAVGGGGEVVGGGAAAEAGGVDDAEALEFFEVAVDGGQVHVRGEGVDLGGEVFGAAVLAAAEQRGEQQPAGRGGPPAVRAHEGHDLLDRVPAGGLGHCLGCFLGHASAYSKRVQLHAVAIANRAAPVPAAGVPAPSGSGGAGS